MTQSKQKALEASSIAEVIAILENLPETHTVFSEKAETYLGHLRKNPVEATAFLKRTGIIDANGSLTDEYSGEGTPTHAY